MVAGHLQEKKGYFYMVLSYPDAAGKRKTKWLPTGLPVKGNKKKAEKMLMETRQTFVPECKPIQEDMLFSDFLLQWLEIAKPTIALTTYSSYSGMAKSVIIPYFKERKITLSEIKATDIQAFYMKQLKRVKANTVIHYHSVIHRALKYAVKIDLISVNPADKVERPKADKFIGSFYDSNEVQPMKSWKNIMSSMEIWISSQDTSQKADIRWANGSTTFVCQPRKRARKQYSTKNSSKSSKRLA